jgi:hypothetical protein
LGDLGLHQFNNSCSTVPKARPIHGPFLPWYSWIKA